MEGRAEEILEYTLSRGADDAVVNAYDEDVRQVRFSESRMDIFNRWMERHFVLFLAKDNRVVATTIKGEDSYRHMVDGAIETALKSPPSQDYRGIAERSRARSAVRRAEEIKDSTLSSFVAQAVDAAARNGASSAGSLYHSSYRRYLTTSNGIRKKEAASSLYFSIRCFADEDASGHAVTSSMKLSDFRPEEAAEKAAGLSKMARGAVKGEEGKYDTVLDPMVTAVLTSQIAEMDSAYAVIAGFSCLKGKVGKRVASEKFSMFDDATRPLLGWRAFDDEGVRTQRTAIISRGILKTYLHNTSTARKFKTRSTGNAGLISPTAFSVSLEAGKRGYEDIMSEIRNGLYINNVWYTRYQNYATGNFSTIPRDAILKIKNGEFAGAVRDLRITENLLRVMKNVKELSSEREHVTWWLESSIPSTVPYILVSGLNLTRSSDIA